MNIHGHYIIFVVICTLVPIHKQQHCESFQRGLFPNHIHIAALVLARGGSKGITLKNLAKFGNASLIENTLQRIRKVTRFQSVWVSTDHKLIAKASEKYAHIHWRSDYTAADNATSIIAVQEFQKDHPEIDVIALIQCTCPFLKETYLNEAINFFLLDRNVDCVFSVSRSFKLRWQVNLEGYPEPINFDPVHRPRRQDWSGELVENGMFYFAKRSLIREGRFQNKCQVVEIDEWDSFEIDTYDQLELANLINEFRQRQRSEK